MKRAELLGVLLKAIGFWSIIGGLSGLPGAFSFFHEYPDEQAFLMLFAGTFMAPVILIITGWFLVRATDWFIGIAGGGTRWTASDESSEGSRELCAVALIALGYWEILNGVVRMPYEFAKFYWANGRSFDSVAYAGIAIVAGCFLVFATQWFVAFAYRTPVISSD